MSPPSSASRLTPRALRRPPPALVPPLSLHRVWPFLWRLRAPLALGRHPAPGMVSRAVAETSAECPAAAAGDTVRGLVCAEDASAVVPLMLAGFPCSTRLPVHEHVYPFPQSVLDTEHDRSRRECGAELHAIDELERVLSYDAWWWWRYYRLGGRKSRKCTFMRHSEPLCTTTARSMHRGMKRG